MSPLKIGTLCVLVAGTIENVGVIVEVTRHVGRTGYWEDAYIIRTTSGRPFSLLWNENQPVFNSIRCITERRNLRPLQTKYVETDQEFVLAFDSMTSKVQV